MTDHMQTPGLPEEKPEPKLTAPRKLSITSEQQGSVWILHFSGDLDIRSLDLAKKTVGDLIDAHAEGAFGCRRCVACRVPKSAKRCAHADGRRGHAEPVIGLAGGQTRWLCPPYELTQAALSVCCRRTRVRRAGTFCRR